MDVRLIDGMRLEKTVENLNFNSLMDKQFILELIRSYPTIDAEPVKHGRWETWGFVFHGIEWKRCSACGKCADVSYYGILDGEVKMSTPALCGCCGAKMDGGAENG